MTSKKRHSNKRLVGLRILEDLIIRHNHRRRSFLPLLSAVCGCLLLLSAALSSLSPPATNHIHHHHHLSLNNSSVCSSFKHFASSYKNMIKKHYFTDSLMNLQIEGRGLGHEQWTSAQSHFFHGCSNASSSFKSTLPYLISATKKKFYETQKKRVSDKCYETQILQLHKRKQNQIGTC